MNEVHDQSLFDDVRLREEIRGKFGPNGGARIEERLQAMRMSALEKLETASIANPGEIMNLQVESQAAHKALLVLIEIMNDGDNAEEELRRRDEEDHEPQNRNGH